MKIAFLGKGGSGKSTLATAMARYLCKSGKRVLAIDADHNMDLAYNLGGTPALFLGDNPSRIKQYIGASDSTPFLEARKKAETNKVTFSLFPPDSFTAQHATELEPHLFIMAAGPHTDIVRSGLNCSHSLAAPLKIYLPLLKLNANEAVVVDERAGTDPVATGILKGVNLAVIVCEPTVHSVRVAKQIASELERAEIPFAFVANKVRNDISLFESLPQAPITHIPFHASDPPSRALQTIAAYIRGL